MVFEFVRSHQKSFVGLALVLLLSLPGSETQNEIPAQWVVWNIGQGAWLTRIEKGHCYHFDAGGEGKFPYHIVKMCRGNKNSITISHSDWDHISFVQKLSVELPNLCREGPIDRKPTRPIARIPECKVKPWWVWRPKTESLHPNDRSSVYFFKSLLYPGDSPKKFEKHWIDYLPGRVTFLILSHHGSYTGTSKKLLEQIRPKLAIASARNRKYGHPHESVVSSLWQARIPLLRTEVWGNIHLLDEVTP